MDACNNNEEVDTEPDGTTFMFSNAFDSRDCASRVGTFFVYEHIEKEGNKNESDPKRKTKKGDFEILSRSTINATGHGSVPINTVSRWEIPREGLPRIG